MTQPIQGANDREPVRIKLYGLVSVTKRGYLTQLVMTGLLLIVWLIWWSYLPPLPPRKEAQPAHVELMRFVVGNVPWIVLVLGLLLALEASIILRRFAREEALRRSRPPEAGSKP
jgi:hypothetical protein